MEFRDKYKDELEAGIMRNYEFNEDFNRILSEVELRSKLESQAPTRMRTFEESKKSQKTVASLKIDKNEKNKESSKNSKKGGAKNKKQDVINEGIYQFEIFKVGGAVAQDIPVILYQTIIVVIRMSISSDIQTVRF